jgi:hypothetical protein
MASATSNSAIGSRRRPSSRVVGGTPSDLPASAQADDLGTASTSTAPQIAPITSPTEFSACLTPTLSVAGHTLVPAAITTHPPTPSPYINVRMDVGPTITKPSVVSSRNFNYSCLSFSGLVVLRVPRSAGSLGRSEVFILGLEGADAIGRASDPNFTRTPLQLLRSFHRPGLRVER